MADQVEGGLQRTQSKAQRKKAKAKARKAAAKLASSADPSQPVPTDVDGDDDSEDLITPRDEAATEEAAPSAMIPVDDPAATEQPTVETTPDRKPDDDPVANGHSEPAAPVAAESAPDAGLQQQIDQLVVSHKSVVSSLDQQVATLTAELATERAARSEADTRATTATERTSQLEQALHDAKEAIAAAAAAAAAAPPSAADEAELATAHISALKSQVAQLESELSAAKSTTPAPGESKLDDELAAAHQEISSLKATISQLKKQVEDLQVEEAVLKDELLEEGKRLRAAEAQSRRVAALEKQVADLQELVELNSALASQTAPSKPSASESKPVSKPTESVAKPSEPAAATPKPVDTKKPEPSAATDSEPRKKVTDRWPAASASSTPEQPADRPVASNTKGKIDLSQRWPAASATSSAPTKSNAPQPREKASGSVKLDAEAVMKAYNAVRDDSNPVNWAAFQHDDAGTRIAVLATGTDGLTGLLPHFQPDNRVYGFVRVVTGDSMSKRAKFVLRTSYLPPPSPFLRRAVVWAGLGLSALKRARHATDKAILKEVVREFAVEMSSNSLDDFTETAIVAACRKAGGADYNAQL